MALHWINGGGEYKQFVANRAMKIEEHSGITWCHVPTKENPPDLGSRGGQALVERTGMAFRQRKVAYRHHDKPHS